MPPPETSMRVEQVVCVKERLLEVFLKKVNDRLAKRWGLRGDAFFADGAYHQFFTGLVELPTGEEP